MCPGLSVFTRMRFGPSSQAMLRAIWSTADLDVLYDTHAWSCMNEKRACQSRMQRRKQDANDRYARRGRSRDIHDPSIILASGHSTQIVDCWQEMDRPWRNERRTLLVMLPLMLATRMILPPFPKRSIWRPAACAVNRTPLTFILNTCASANTRRVSARSEQRRMVQREDVSGYPCYHTLE